MFVLKRIKVTNSYKRIINIVKTIKNFVTVINRRHLENIELRSDVKTLPTKKMRESVLLPEFGDSAKFEDEVVNKLERQVASLLGKERGLYVPSGSMGNNIGLLLYLERGDYLIQGDICHIHKTEIICQKLLGINQILFKNQPNATLELDESKLLKVIETNKDKPDFVKKLKLLTLENTHNFLGGKILPLNYVDKVKAICQNVRKIHQDFNPKFHLDGARVLNAAAKLNIEPKELTKGFDTVSLCLSKGIGAPVGSVICMEDKYFEKAAELRRGLGGSMRQAGFIAAPGLIALEDWKERFAIDHENSRKLYNGLKNIKGLCVTEPDTNIVNIHLESKYKSQIFELTEKLKNKNIYVYNMFNGEYIRLVTHHQVTIEQIEKVIIEFNVVCKDIFK